MTRSRLEAFSDGVIAILITIMVLELRPPADALLADLRPLVPKLLSYLLSFQSAAHVAVRDASCAFQRALKSSERSSGFG